MESETKAGTGNDSNVSCFAVDGVVAEMVIDIDVDDSPQKLKDITSQKSKPNSEVLCDDLYSESVTTLDKEIEEVPKENENSTTLKSNKLTGDESLNEDVMEIDESEHFDASAKLGSSSKEDDLRKGLISDLNQIREAARLIDENKDEILKVTHLRKKSKKGSDLSDSKKLDLTLKSADGEKECELKKISKSEMSIEKGSPENILPTAISTRGNKRKLIEIENDTVKSKRRKNTVVKQESESKERQEIHSQSNSESINLVPLSNSTFKKYDMFEKDSRLMNFLHFKKSLNEVDLKFSRQLYRVLFDKWAPIDVAQLKTEMLQFCGFPFDRFSEEVLKRKHILKKLPALSLKKICYMLDLPKGKTDDMIDSILKFLHKPTNTVHCTVDPFQSCMQPFVKLEKLPIEYNSLLEKEKKRDSSNQQSRKAGLPPKKLLEYKHLLEMAKKNSYNISQQFRKPGQKKIENKSLTTKKHSNNMSQQKRKADQLQKKKTNSSQKTARQTGTNLQKKSLSPVVVMKDVQKSSPEAKSLSKILPTTSVAPKKVKVAVKSDKKMSSPIEEKKSSFNVSSASTSSTKKETITKKVSRLKNQKLAAAGGKKSGDGKKPFKTLKAPVQKKASLLKSVQKKKMKNRIKKLKKEISELKVKVDESQSFIKAQGNAENGALLPSFGKGKENEDDQSNTSFFAHQDLQNEDYSSEVTLSADENVEEAKKVEGAKKKKKKMMRCGKPIRSFANIRESIQNGNFSALQRLHILLFGASDKPENLKANILAFGGFPFLEGSDDWKQKEFLLSLLSLSTLKEYSTLLCIDHAGDDQQTVINKLMKFLAAPGGSSEIEVELIEDDPLPEMETHVVHSEPVKPIRIVDAKSIAPVAPKKKVVKKKEKPPANKANRKVLMSEAEVRRLEADIKREQRIRDREKRLNDELALKRAMALTQQRQTTLQKNVLLPQSSSLNMHRTPLGTFVSQPTSTSGIIGNVSNYQTVSNVPRTPSGPAVKTQKGTPKVPLPAIVKQADAEQLNALLQTVYKRRALKASGATISTPNKGESSKLGDLPNVKFLVVTANYSDLDVLHHLIYMTDAVKAKVRKNILDFSGFGFNEDSPLYKDRIMFLNTLGYDISKRIAFLLGLCPYKTNIDKQDLNELILYFLMSPCKTKQVPITHLPQTFFSKNMPEELCLLMQKHSELDISPIPVDSNVEESQINLSKPSSSSIAGSPLGASSSTSYIKPHPAGPKAKKSLLTSKLKKTTVSPSSSSTPFQNAAVLLKPNTSKSMDTALQKAILKTSSLIPEPVSSPQEFLVQQLTPDGRQKTYKLIKLPMNHPLTTALKPQIPITTPSPVIQLPPIQTTASSILQKPSNSTPNIPTPPVQVPTSGSIIQTPPVQFTSQTSLLSTPPVSLSSTAVNAPGMVIPPGIIIFKDNKNNPPLAITSVPNNNLQTVPIIFGQQNPIILPQNVITAPPEAGTKLNVPSPINALTKVILPQNVPSSPKKASTLSEKEDLTIEETSAAVAPESPIQVKKTNLETTKVVSGPASKSPFSKIGPGKKFQLPIQVSKTAVSPVRKPIKSNPPTDNELYSSIKRIIFNSDPEQITLGNVIEKVSVQYASHNLKSRTRFMKDCVKKIILGTT